MNYREECATFDTPREIPTPNFGNSFHFICMHSTEKNVLMKGKVLKSFGKMKIIDALQFLLRRFEIDKGLESGLMVPFYHSMPNVCMQKRKFNSQSHFKIKGCKGFIMKMNKHFKKSKCIFLQAIGNTIFFE